MKIGLLIYGSLDTLSGGYLYDRKLVNYLRNQGDLVQVISLPWRNYFRHLADNFSPRLYHSLAGLDVDVLLQDELNHPSLFLLNRRLAQKKGYPVISIVHHLRCREARPGWQNRLYAWVERRYLASLDGFVFNSQATQQEVEGLLGEGLQLPGVVAYPAGDRFHAEITPEEIARRAGLPGPLQLIFVGNVIPRKGLHTLIAALAQAASQAGLFLTVVGDLQADKAYAARLRRQVARAGLEAQVRFTGRLTDEQLAKALRESQVLVAPSSYEGFGIVYLEAMGFGLPAIGAKAGGAGEIITPGKDGYLIGPGDAQALSARLAELAHDRQRLLSLSLAARQRFEQHPSWQESMQRIRTFLLE